MPLGTCSTHLETVSMLDIMGGTLIHTYDDHVNTIQGFKYVNVHNVE